MTLNFSRSEPGFPGPVERVRQHSRHQEEVERHFKDWPRGQTQGKRGDPVHNCYEEERSLAFKTANLLTTHTRILREWKTKRRERINGTSTATYAYIFFLALCCGTKTYTLKGRLVNWLLNGICLISLNHKTTVFKCQRGRQTQGTARGVMGVLFSGEK